MLNNGQTSLKILKLGHFSTFCMKGLTHFGAILQFFFSILSSASFTAEY